MTDTLKVNVTLSLSHKERVRVNQALQAENQRRIKAGLPGIDDHQALAHAAIEAWCTLVEIQQA